MVYSLYDLILLLLYSILLKSASCLALQTTMTPIFGRHHHRASMSSSALGMGRNRGLETRSESASPQEGGMVLYLKAGPDGASSIGDCPFAHAVRLVLEEKRLDYEVQPATPDTKPTWLVDAYQGKLPALRHRKEAYVESTVICDYLDFFFPEPPLKASNGALQEQAEAVMEGFFPAMARYFRHATNGDDQDGQLEATLRDQLANIEAHLAADGPYLVGDQVTLSDLALAPKLFHLVVGLDTFKKESTSIAIPQQYPRLQAYMDAMFARESFTKTAYPRETVVWGWANARQ